MNEDNLGRAIAIVLFGVIPWLVFFYSNISLFYLRHEFYGPGQNYTVECRYINATSSEWPQIQFPSKAYADQYYCPRWKRIGEAIR